MRLPFGPPSFLDYDKVKSSFLLYLYIVYVVLLLCLSIKTLRFPFALASSVCPSVIPHIYLPLRFLSQTTPA